MKNKIEKEKKKQKKNCIRSSPIGTYFISLEAGNLKSIMVEKFSFFFVKNNKKRRKFKSNQMKFN